MSTIFISHRNAPSDNSWAEKIHHWIKKQKAIDGFLDFDVQSGLQAGNRWEDEIYAAMNRAQVVIALISPEWLASDWCLSEARMAKLRGLKLIPLVIAECDFPFPDIQSITLDRGEDRAFEELRQALSTTHKLPARPYPGLAAFQEDDAAVFFGREDETRDLANRVECLFQGRPETPRLLLVLGASGSGKSSLIRAGLIPAFKATQTHICMEPIIPRGAPLKELAHALDVELRGADAAADADTVLAAFKRASPGYQRALIAIDQAEELLRGDHQFFFDVLRALADRGEGRVLILATMRSDFLNEFQQSGLIGAVSAFDYDTFPLDPLPEDRLNDIIRKPAELFGVTYEDGLVIEITKDHGGPDALPLLAFFLDEIWRDEYISTGVLQIAEYRSFGGLNKALRKAVDRAIEGCVRLDCRYADTFLLLDDLAEVFLGHLVSISAASGEAVRSRARAAALSERERDLLAAFARQRLLIEKDDEWEVVHEALFRQWSNLQKWIDTAREDLIAIDRMQMASIQWHEAGRGDADLTHFGNRLDEVARLHRSKRYVGRFTPVDLEYLNACNQKYQDQLANEAALRREAEEGRAQALHGERRATQRTKFAAVVAIVALLAGGVAAWLWTVAEGQTQLAKDEALQALKSQRLGLAALSSSELQAGRATEAAQLALAAWPRRANPSDDLSDYATALQALSAANSALREVSRMSGNDGWVYSVAFSRDGTKIASGSADGALKLWDPNTIASDDLLNLPHPREVYAVAFSPDGSRIASGDGDGILRIWNATNGALVGESMTGHRDAIRSIAFSPDGARIVTGSFDQTLKLWSLSQGLEQVLELTGHEGAVYSVSFSPDGTQIASGGDDNIVRLWNLSEEVSTAREVGEHGDTVRSVAFSPDGRQLASGSVDGTLIFWDLAHPATHGVELQGHTGAIYSVAFSPDGTELVTAGEDKSLRLWDASAQNALTMLRGHGDAVLSAVFSPNGNRILSGGLDGTLRLWDASRGTAKSHRFSHASGVPVEDVAFSPNGDLVVSGGLDGRLRFWDVNTRSLLGDPVEAHGRGRVSVAFSSDGSQVVSGGRDKALRLWDTATRSAIGNPLEGHSGSVTSVAFSPEGKRIVSGSRDKSLRLWDAVTGKAIGGPMQGHNDSVTSVAFSPDGDRILSGSRDKTLRLWDATKLTAIGDPMTGHEKSINSVAFFPDTDRIVSASDDRTIRVWSTKEVRTIGDPLKGHMASVLSIAVSSDGKRIVSAGAEGAVRLWDAATGAGIGYPMSVDRSRVFSVAFSTLAQQIVSGGDNGEIRVWDESYGEGTIFELVCQDLPTSDTPEVLERYGIVVDEPYCTGNEPLPLILPKVVEE